jgi:predicted amidohydrolase YtcJ
VLRADDPRSRSRQDAMLRVGPLKAFSDGGVQGAYLRAEYDGRPGYRGLELLDERAVAALTEYALDAGWQLSLHALGGAAIDRILGVWLERADRVRGRRFSIQHAFDPSEDNMRACAELGAVVGIHQSLFYMYGPQMLDAWRGNVGSGLNPVRAWREHAVRVAGGSDIAPHDPLVALMSLVTRRTESGDVIGPEQAIGAADGVRLLTEDAAFGNFDDELVGALTPGRRADVVVLSECPTEVDPESLPGIGVVATLVDGRPTHLDAAAPAALGDLAT